MATFELNTPAGKSNRYRPHSIIQAAALCVPLCLILLNGCGSVTKLNPVSPPVVQAAPPIDAASTFPPAQPLICNGDPGNQSCTYSDGSTFYHLEQMNVTTRPDGHGTFQLISEVGIAKGGLYEIPMRFGQKINVIEMHATLSVDSWCDQNGIVASLEGANGHLVEHIFGGKTLEFKAGQESNFVIPQTVFPQPIPLDALNLVDYSDLCARTTVHWVIDGSF
jgi:hypothetical protein